MINSISSSSNYNSAAASQMRDKMFSKIDQNNDGQIDKSEMTSFQAKKKDKNGPSVDEIFTKMDTNGDGTISKEESDAGLERMKNEMLQNAKEMRASQKPSGPPPGPPPADGADSMDSANSTEETDETSDTDSETSKIAADLSEYIKKAIESYLKNQEKTNKTSAENSTDSLLKSDLYV